MATTEKQLSKMIENSEASVCTIRLRR